MGDDPDEPRTSLVRPRHRAPRHPGWRLGYGLVFAAAGSGLLVVGMGVHPPAAVSSTTQSQLEALVRVAMTSLVAATLLLGPGLVLRARLSGADSFPLGFVPVPGLLVLATLGLVVWVAAPDLDAHLVSRVGVLLVLVVIAALAARSRTHLHPEELRIVAVLAMVFLVTLGKSLWSLGPEGELYAGTVSRTLEVGDRPDSRISYHVSSLVGNGLSAHDGPGKRLFSPYAFADRGPAPGLVAAPVMLAVGTSPSPGLPDQPWSLFDPQGFVVYRIVMMMVALTALLAVHTVARAVAGSRVALLAVLVTAGTPFFVHEVYFTWPKLAAAAMCLLGAFLVLKRRHLGAGFLVALGFLMHPLALLSIPTLALLALVTGGDGSLVARLRHTARATATLAIGTGGVVATWLLLNLAQPGAGGFLGYIAEADTREGVSLPTWISSRLVSVGNTLVPLFRMRNTDDPSINSLYAPSDSVVHFFFQHWVGLPFGGGIVLYPLLVLALVRGLRHHAALVASLVVVPFVGFAVYWGGYDSGLMREGLHPWVLTVLVLWSLTWRRSRGVAGLPPWLRLILAARLLEVLLMLVVPTIHFHRAVLAASHRAGDVAALLLMLVGLVSLTVITVRWTGSAVEGDPDPSTLPHSRHAGARHVAQA